MPSHPFRPPFAFWPTISTAALLTALTGCSIFSSSRPAPTPPVPTASNTPSTGLNTAPSTAPGRTAMLVSEALTPRAYRVDAASHLYARQTGRIFQGKMPPLLYAVGVLQVDINRVGAVTDIRWMRAPSHAPEVMADIERTVRAAAPFPAPQRMGRVTYTDTWLWDKSGRFQLDTLTEGQL